jgi:hypothetical protein
MQRASPNNSKPDRTIKRDGYREHAATRRAGAVHTQKSFAANNGFSISKYFQLKRQGRAPEEIEIDGRIIITEEAEEAWRRRMALETARRRLERAERELARKKGREQQQVL